MRRYRLIVTWLPLLLCSACAAWLPQSHIDTTPFESFEAARKAVLELEPMKCDLTMLEKNGLNIAKPLNLTLLTHADVVRRFLPSSLLKRGGLDAGLLRCLEAGSACHGIEVAGAVVGHWAGTSQQRGDTQVRQPEGFEPLRL